MTYFLKSGNTYKVATNEALDLHQKLPVGNYTIKKDQYGNLYLEHIGDFVAPKKIYGDCLKNTDRIINTFHNRPNTTGVMLTGEKGSGKTLLTKNVCMELAKQGIPTIVVNAAYYGDAFNTFIQSIDQPCAILFDEFEKVYDRDEQEQILTLLDGVFPTKKLFLLTCNDKYRIDYFMRNRPGRIYYMLDFKGLDSEFIREYCEDNLEAKEYIEKIITLAGLFGEFNFDMLKALVEEMNRYGETPQEALRMLNIKPEFDNGTRYNVKLSYKGRDVTESSSMSNKEFDGNPLRPTGIEVSFDSAEDDDSDYTYVVFTADTLVRVDARQGTFVFEDKGVNMTLTKAPIKFFNFDAV
jgi:hypothetical protein